MFFSSNKFNNIFYYKYLIVDQSNTASDPLVLRGSHNWSNGTDQKKKKDENTMIAHDAASADIYYQEFNQCFKDELTGIERYEVHATALIYPDPAGNDFFVKIDSQEATADLGLKDILGKQVASVPRTNMTHEVIMISDLQLPAGVYIAMSNP